MAEVQIIRLVGDEKRTADTIQGVSRHWQGQKESFLFISPHDDDIVVGAGLFIQQAVSENVPVHILIVTDGSMGYCSAEEQKNIADIRRNETYRCYQSLGVPKENIYWLGFPDCRLNLYRGRKTAEPDDPVIKGFTGLQNAFTYYLRKVKPKQCFLPTSSDLHPDHRYVHSELLISMYHATGAIWPEIGTPLETTPYIHEIACYCNFPEPPQLRIKTPTEMLKKKLDAIAAFQSQRQITSVLNIVKGAGPVEYIRELKFKLYNPNEYKILFEEPGTFNFVH